MVRFAHLASQPVRAELVLKITRFSHDYSWFAEKEARR